MSNSETYSLTHLDHSGTVPHNAIGGTVYRIPALMEILYIVSLLEGLTGFYVPLSQYKHYTRYFRNKNILDYCYDKKGIVITLLV